MLKAQAVGSLIITVATFAISLAVMSLINALGQLRVSAHGESVGLDIYEHGMPAYPEYVKAADAIPAGSFAQSEPSLEPVSPIDVTKPEAASSMP